MDIPMPVIEETPARPGLFPDKIQMTQCTNFGKRHTHCTGTSPELWLSRREGLWCRHLSTCRQSQHIEVKPTRALHENAPDPYRLLLLVRHSSFVDQPYVHWVTASVCHLQCFLESAHRRMQIPIPLPGKHRQYTIKHDLTQAHRTSKLTFSGCVCVRRNLLHSSTQQPTCRQCNQSGKPARIQLSETETYLAVESQEGRVLSPRRVLIQQ